MELQILVLSHPSKDDGPPADPRRGDDDLLVVPVTGQAVRVAYDVILRDWKAAGLRLPSVARLEKLATIERTTVLRSLGRTSAEDWAQVKEKLTRRRRRDYPALMTNAPDEGFAWLQEQGGHRIPIRGSCSIGRAASNEVPLASDKVSRRHALIQVQGESEFWLVDFGSRNGTYLNARRITDPKRLQHGDRITIGSFEFVFLLSEPRQRGLAEATVTERTVDYIRETKCWLLVADIIGSTRLVKELPPDEVPVITGRWLAECKQTIEEHGGSINQFFGDGFFAYWRDREKVQVAVAATLQALRRLQEQARPGFRVVAHYGEAVIGGVSLGEEERISGREVHFTFRMEKLAGQLKETRLLSQSAWERLAALIEARAVGEYVLPGFESKVPMYAF